jgi:hypothetical protein
MERGINRVVQLEIGDGTELIISESHDSIQRFEDHSLDHLRYWDADRKSLVTVWLGKEALDFLMENGIPETMRARLTDLEEENYIEYQSNILEMELENFNNE